MNFFITEIMEKGTNFGHLVRQVDHSGTITQRYEHLTPEELDIIFPTLD